MDDRFSLAGKTALVTGASGGLGSHFARTLGLAGAAVILAGRHRDPLVRLAEGLAASGITATAQPMDVADADSVRLGLDEVQARAGMIDIAVCAAGIATNKPALSLSTEEWDRVIAVNLRGAWITASEIAHRLVAARRPGSLILVSSILGHRVAGNVLPYTVSKAGLEQMTRALALEWARHGIRVNALAPGYIETDLNQEFFASDAGQTLIRRIPQRHLGQPQDLDGPLLLLASDASAYMTGSSLVVDGGHLQSTL
ncbi:MAG: SDR family oxidoreductase [Castellaniella sp.]|uniref:SDR family NAD(P)-dependent oxidoreductase n=1 Tax=Castellaniella sp. TaxID=1955812 RepID=UPI001220282A|nr:SDR family oxidoreductase [Castellaniella sp.]TAN28491.1 MAG: SDR family oxidoreductase [Castellaniella sp.]